MTQTIPPRRKQAHVLLVEDNAADVYVTRRAFARGRSAATLHVVGDGEEAMEFLRAEGRWTAAPRPDYVLLDLNMPRKDGREVLSEVRGDPSLRRIPVVVLTSSAADTDLYEVYDLGANVVFTKPNDPDVLTRIVVALEEVWFVLGQLPPR